MTSPVKPPRGPRDVASLVDGGRGVAARSETREHVAGAEAEPTSAVRASSSALEPVLAALADDLRSGRVAPSGVVDAIVARAVGGADASSLTDEGRRALEAHLRTTLAEDPAFVRLVADLARAR